MSLLLTLGISIYHAPSYTKDSKNVVAQQLKYVASNPCFMLLVNDVLLLVMMKEDLASPVVWFLAFIYTDAWY